MSKSHTFQETARYVQYAELEHFIILYDKIDKNYAIHSKDPDNDVGIVANFPTAADAINFAHYRIVSVGRDSRER